MSDFIYLALLLGVFACVPLLITACRALEGRK